VFLYKGVGMKIVVIGGSGLIGTKLVNKLRQECHEVITASPSTGVNTLTGEGLLDTAVMNFFETSGRNLMSAEATTGVTYHVALSIVGTERMQGSGYFRAKMTQEELIKSSEIPYTIVRATQFFEFVEGIAEASTVEQTVRLTTALFQPIASDDVVAALADVALAAPINGIIEVAGPESLPMDEAARRLLNAKKDTRQVIGDMNVGYFGMKIDDQSLRPSGGSPRIGSIRFDDWISYSMAKSKG
jgi:uncharacterized protein YbjT (DUF2867 family)